MDNNRRSSDDLKKRPRSNPYSRSRSGRERTSRERAERPSRQSSDYSDVYSNTSHNTAGRVHTPEQESGFDLNRMASRNSAKGGRNSKNKKSGVMAGKKRILINVALSLLLVISLLGSTAFTLLESRILVKKEEDVEQGEFESVVTSPSGDVSYFLICGTDLSEKLTDIMMVACYDLKNNRVDILQLPRDSYVGTDQGLGKLNSVYQNAREGESPIKALIRRINKEFALPIDHYITVTIPGFRKIVDALGGVEMTFTRAYHVEDSRPVDNGGKAVKITLAEGATKDNPITLNLKGYEAEGFVRHRNSYNMGDLGRVEAQRKFYAAFAKKVVSMNFSQLSQIVTNCMSDITTDLSLGQMLGYAEKAHSLDLNNVTIEAVPGGSRTVRARSDWPRQSYFSVDKSALVELLNAKFRPYETTLLTEDDLEITSVPGYSRSDNYFGNDESNSFSSINGDATTTTTTASGGN